MSKTLFHSKVKIEDNQVKYIDIFLKVSEKIDDKIGLSKNKVTKQGGTV